MDGGLPRLDPGLFDWQAWRAGNPAEVFGLFCRSEALIAGAQMLRRAAVGWCPGDDLLCRPKSDSLAIMFVLDERNFWFHLRVGEARAIFDL